MLAGSAFVGAAVWCAASSFGAGAPTAGIAFVKSVTTTTVWVAAADGSGARELGAAADPLLSPDGQLVAATAIGRQGTALVIFKVGGGTLATPRSLTNVALMPLAWSPDSRYLAVALFDTGTGTDQGNAALDVVDTKAGTVAASVPGIVSGASFAPTGDRVVFGLSHSQLSNAPANLYSLSLRAAKPKAAALTHDGHSINPVWGRRGIVFDHVTPRKMGPAYQLVLMHGSHTTQITHMTLPALIQGLVPLAVSADGTKLAAEYEGEDTSEGYSVDLVTDQVTQLVVGTQENSAFGISRDGGSVLVSYGGFEGPSTNAVIATMPFAGGTPTVLINGGYQPSWNQ